MREIALTQGKFAIVDDVDYEWAMQWEWSYWEKGKSAYARTGKCRLMHREILENKIGRTLLRKELVDHKNNVGCDNRRENIRLASRSENAMNMRPKHGSSIFKGVHWCSNAKRWVALITINYKCIYLGTFKDETEAARAYDQAAYRLFGEYALVNFPDILPDLLWRMPKRTPSSLFNGVSFHKGSKKAWVCRARWGGKVHSIGRFYTEEQAARAYDKAVWENTSRGLEWLNFPEEFVVYA